MSAKECINKLSPALFWDIDKEDADLDKYPAFFIQRVLERGNMNDWQLIQNYFGIPRIADYCKTLRTLDPVCLSFICTISHTNKEDYRCWKFAQSFPTPWNS